MKNKKVVLKSLIGIFMCIEIISIFLMMKANQNRELYKKEIKNNENALAIYIKSEDGSYVKSFGNTWPGEGYRLNENYTKCLDLNSELIENAFSYADNTFTLTTTKVAFCYLFFDATGVPAGLDIFNSSPSGLEKSTLLGNMYRFVGQQSSGVNNYVCFGTSDQGECTSYPDKYMYRIIGIENDTYRLKVIKKDALDSTYSWASDNTTYTPWSESQIFYALNGDDFLRTDNYISDAWRNKIDNYNWLYGSMMHSDTTYGAKQGANGIYDIESGKTLAKWYEKAEANNNNVLQEKVHSDKVNAKIGLVNLSDVYFAPAGGSLLGNVSCHGEVSSSSNCSGSWLTLVQNDATAPSNIEWSMSRNGWDTNYYYINTITNGTITNSYQSDKYSVRPVFYINYVNLKGGNGTMTDPFIIE